MTKGDSPKITRVAPRQKPKLASVIEIRTGSQPAKMPAIPAEEALSWTERNMADSLNISTGEARHVIAILELNS